jgi:hypothetical protein
MHDLLKKKFSRTLAPGDGNARRKRRWALQKDVPEYDSKGTERAILF